MKLRNEKFHTPQKTLFIRKFQSSPCAKKQTNGIVNTFACPIMLDGDLFSLQAGSPVQLTVVGKRHPIGSTHCIFTLRT